MEPLTRFHLEQITSIKYLSWPAGCSARAPEAPQGLQQSWEFIGSGDFKNAFEDPEGMFVLKIAKDGCAEACEQDFWGNVWLPL